MNEEILPQESKKFIRILMAVSLVWLLLGIIIQSQNSHQIIEFIQIFLFTFLDLIFLLLLFWELFFTSPSANVRRANKVRIMLFGFFKLVCLLFLAITLKRLRNASALTLLMGIGFIWMGPLISGVLLKYSLKVKK